MRTRQIVCKISNKIISFINCIRFSINGIHYDEDMCIHGFPGIYLSSNSKFTVGKHFYMSNGKHINPLCRNIQGSFHVNENAYLIIGDNVGMSSPVIWSHESITIGNNVNIGANTIIVDSDCHSINFLDRRDITTDMLNKRNTPIIIKDDVLVGMNCIILKGVTIGARSIIGAGSVVTKSVPADCIAAGNPAKIIKHLV